MMDYFLCFFAFISTLIITIVIESKILPVLKRRARQPIYSEGPSWHLSKKGTPTMGGVAFVTATTFTLLLLSLVLLYKNGKNDKITSIIITTLFALANSLVGLFDDITKLVRNKNAGLTPFQKLAMQFVIAIIFLMARRHFIGDMTYISLWFGKIDFGLLYYPMSLILILGIVNCANLTDGIDGLASSVALTGGLVFLLLSSNINFDTQLISLSLIGGTLGFLLFNRHPAKIFMGDTGSLFLGALASALAFSIGNPLVIVLVGMVYVIEGVSVILQVAYYKLTGKRLFTMAPLHHHLEKQSVSENSICLIMVIITLIASALAPFIFRW